MSKHILGIDIAKESLDVALLGGRQTDQGHFSNDQEGWQKLVRWLDKRRVERAHVCLEATSRYGEEVATCLHEAGHVVSVVNPKLIKKHGETTMQRNKTDKQDARLIADYCAKHQPGPWTPPPLAYRQLQAMVRHVAALKQDLQRERNRREAGSQPAEVLAAMDSHIAFLEEQITALQQRIQTHIDHHPDLKEKQELLLSIPGVGSGVATTFLAEVPDVHRFAQVAQLDAFVGLSPGNRQSGSSLNSPGHIVKWGNSHLRAILFMPALSAHRWNPIAAALRERLQERGKNGLTIVVAVMRKLLHLCYGVLKTGKPFDPNHPVQAHFPT